MASHGRRFNPLVFVFFAQKRDGREREREGETGAGEDLAGVNARGLTEVCTYCLRSRPQSETEVSANAPDGPWLPTVKRYLHRHPCQPWLTLSHCCDTRRLLSGTGARL